MVATSSHSRNLTLGLSTYGHAARAIIEAYCGGNAALLKSIRVRFASPVIPGMLF